MKVPAALLTLALAGAAVAQGGPELPACAQECATEALNGGIGDCGRDVKCICSNGEFLESIACCLVGVCGAEEQAQAVEFAGRICNGAGVNVPTAVTCANPSATSGAATSSHTSGESASTTAAPTGTDNDDGDDAATTATSTTTESSNLGPRPTAAAGLGAIGGIIAAVALL